MSLKSGFLRVGLSPHQASALHALTAELSTMHGGPLEAEISAGLLMVDVLYALGLSSEEASAVVGFDVPQSLALPIAYRPGERHEVS